jgi:hypothetical protein
METMKRLLLAMLVLGLVGYATLDDGSCPLGRRLHDLDLGRALHGHRTVAREREAAERAARDAERARRDAMRAIADAHREAEEAARQAARDAEQARRDAVREAEELAREAERIRRDAARDAEDAAREALESVADIPVPIVPGPRVVDAVPAPPAPPAPPRPRRPAPVHASRRVVVAPQPMWASPAEIRKVVGRPSATEDRAQDDARRQLREDVQEWLEPAVGRSWRPSERQLDAMVVGVRVSPEVKPYATVYTAEIDADFSAGRRDELLRSHRRDVVRDRIFKLAGLLAFVLICLAAVSGYIRADEATRGYYTNRLRMLAAAGVGAAGAAIYQMIA